MNVKNKKCIRRLSWRSLLASRKRNAIAMIAIALTALLFTSLFTVALSINSSYETYTFRQIGGYAHGTFKDVTDEQIQEIAAHSKVKEIGKRTTIGFLDGGAFAKVSAEISFMDANCTEWSYAAPTTGHRPEKANEIIMDSQALALLGIEPEIGTEITLTYTLYNSSRTDIEVTDTFELVGWWEYDVISPVHYINVSEKYVSAVESKYITSDMEPFRTDLDGMMASPLDIRGQMEQALSDLGYTGEEGHDNTIRIGVNWGYTSSQFGSNTDMGTVLTIVALLALVIFTGYLIIYNIFQISVTGDIRFYGLLKTIGVTPRQLRRIIRQQALCLCAVGIPLGLLLGYGIGAGLTPLVIARTSLSVTATTVSTSPLIFLASALFALITVLISCSRPGKIASKVSPVEATKYTEVVKSKKKRRATRGAKVHQMAFANLGRNKTKTILVVISLALSVVLLNVLVTFTGGFDMEKYLKEQTCADFVVGSADYFRYRQSGSYISQEEIEQIKTNTSTALSGCGYKPAGYKPYGWINKENWLQDMMYITSEENAKAILEEKERRDDLVGEGLDEALFDKLTVVEGDISPLFQKDSNAIAVAVYTDDYGKVSNLDYYPPIGSAQTITYIDEAKYIDSRTGELCDENTPDEFLQLQITDSHDVDYTICAYVIVPYSMSFRYASTGYEFVLPVEVLNKDSHQESLPMFYLFDTPDDAAEVSAEEYLADLTASDLSGLMYESKVTLRAEFESFQNMFLLLGGLLCAIIGLVGILNFFNAIMAGILSRKREFAVLQAVGMTSKQLKSMLVYEGLFYALTSAAAALVLSVVLNPLVSNLLENMFWFFSANFTIVPVIGVVPIFALLGWMIPSVMYSHIAKYSIVERLRDNG